MRTNKQGAYTRSWNNLKSIACKSISDVRYDELQLIVDNIDTYYKKRDTKTVIAGIFSVARKNDSSIQDISNLIEIGTAPKTKKETFSSEEISTLWSNVDKIPFVKYIIIMIYTGMRPGELQILTQDMIDLDGNKIIGAGLKTELGEEQPIIFPNLIKPFLIDYIPSYKKKAFGRNFKSVINELKLNENLTPNCCRHTTATSLAEIETNPAIVQRVLRHASPDTAIKNYIHIQDDVVINSLSSVNLITDKLPSYTEK